MSCDFMSAACRLHVTLSHLALPLVFIPDILRLTTLPVMLELLPSHWGGG